MKSLIKQLLRKNLLSEQLVNVDEDVDMLYVKYFEYDVNELAKTGIIRNDMFLNTETNTVILKSKECVEAHKLNMCIIKINTGSNFYSPLNNTIGIGISNNSLNYVKTEANGNFRVAIDSLPNDRQKESLSREFNEEKIKGSIHHELAHWIDDTLHNKHIRKRLNKATEIGTRDLGGIPVNSTKMEIQGQIHNIKQLYNKYKDIWDTLSFSELVKYSPALSTINNNLSGDIKTKWIRDLKTRMHREGLLGKNMT